MPLDFPTSPTNGQVYDQWQWDGAKWVAIVGTLPAGPAGPTGPPGVSAGRIFYYDATDASDIAGYAKLLASPSANPEKTIAVACTGVGVDFAVEEFASDPGVPGAVDYPAGTAYRRIYAHVNSGTARLHLRIYIRTAAGVETLVRDEVSPDFTDQTVALQEWVASAPAGGAMLATDRIVNKLSAQRVTGGGGTVTVTCHFEGTTTGSHIQTTIATGGSLAGMIAGQIPIAASATAIASSANLSGDVTSNPTLVTTLATVNANVGTFQGLTLDAKGRVTAAVNQNYVTGGPYLSLAGGTMTGTLGVTVSSANQIAMTSPFGTACNLVFTVTSQRTWLIGSHSTGPFQLTDQTAGLVRLQINNDGSCFSTTGTWSSLSDARVKRDFSAYPRGLSEVLALNPTEFYYNGEGGTVDDGVLHFGLIAQEVQPVLPEVVHEREWAPPAEEGRTPEEPVTLLGVDPGQIIYALIGAIKELNAKVEEIKAALPPGIVPLPAVEGN